VLTKADQGHYHRGY